MPYDPDKHHRRSIRLPGYDYSAQGFYFVTICVQHRACVLGEILGAELLRSDVGDIVARSWQWLAEHHRSVTLDAWTIMPNHVHGIIIIAKTEKQPKPLGRLIGAFKTVSTKRINERRGTPGALFWQRDFYEHIIRDDMRLHTLRDYIVTNPARWQDDRLNNT